VIPVSFSNLSISTLGAYPSQVSNSRVSAWHDNGKAMTSDAATNNNHHFFHFFSSCKMSMSIPLKNCGKSSAARLSATPDQGIVKRMMSG
jgi:hypothetical protein